MAASTRPGALPGFRDFYPSELAERSYLFEKWRDVARRFAFSEYDGPPLESLELYTRKSGEEIVGQLYAFADKGGREVALRPEMTPTLARMVAARVNALRKPVRWFSIPQLFRYERQQRGRLREHFQLNLDILGEPDVTADAELLAAAIEIMRSLGLSHGDVHARVSDRRILEAYLRGSGVQQARLAEVFAVIDKLDRQPADASNEKLAAAGVEPAAREAVLRLAQVSIEEVSRTLAQTNGLRVVDDYRRYQELLGALIGPEWTEWVRFDLSVVRGLAYYTGIVFELHDTRGEYRAICGGGRYDNLLGALGGSDLPALGFGMGDVVLTELLRDRRLLPDFSPAVDFWVAADGEGLLPHVARVAAALRSAGASVEYALRAQSIDKQRKAAKAAGAARIVTVDRPGIEQGQVRMQWGQPGDARAQGGAPSASEMDLDELIRAWPKYALKESRGGTS